MSVERTFPVIETFGPTLQGEGALAGAPTLFVRFGGCDYHCSWCDSLYAVEPEQVRENARKLTAEEIVYELLALIPGQRPSGLWVTLSGGNPALMNFDRAPMRYAFIAGLQRHGFRVSVETQGSVWREWLADVDHLTVSPKPPSSGMLTDKHREQTDLFLMRAETRVDRDHRSMKIVVFDDDDLEYARGMIRDWPRWASYLSAGTSQDHLHDEIALHQGIADRYRWLAEKVAGDPDFRDSRILCQLHVIAWGAARGV